MKKIVMGGLIAALAMGGVVLLMQRKAQLADAKPAPVLPVVVDAMVMATTPVLLTLPAMGVVVSELSTTLSTKVTGQILQVFKQEGDAVKKGERLALIDAHELTAKKQGLMSQRQGLDYQMATKQEDTQSGPGRPVCRARRPWPYAGAPANQRRLHRAVPPRRGRHRPDRSTVGRSRKRFGLP